VPENTPVRSDGEQVGTVYDLLGSHEEDIFHGIVVQLKSKGRRVFVPADDVAALTASHVDVSLSAGELGALRSTPTSASSSWAWRAPAQARGLGQREDR